MSNTDTAPAEVACAASAFIGILHPREVPLGGPRAIRVRRTLPQRERSLIGAWCFADHYGPHDVRDGTGMDVPPHPHTGLQTVSWLFEGEVEAAPVCTPWSGPANRLPRPRCDPLGDDGLALIRLDLVGPGTLRIEATAVTA